MKSQTWLSIISITLAVLLVSSAIGLAIFIVYGYLPDLGHQQQTSCIVNNCTFQQWTCCHTCGAIVHSTCCNTCTDYLVNFTLDLNNTNYTKIIGFNTCPPYVTCYYDDRNVYNTLSLIPLNPPWSVVGVMLLSIFICVILIGLIIVGCITCCCMKPTKNENDDL